MSCDILTERIRKIFVEYRNNILDGKNKSVAIGTATRAVQEEFDKHVKLLLDERNSIQLKKGMKDGN